MTKQKLLDLLERAAWTFVQAFVAVFSVAALGWLNGVIEWVAGGSLDNFPPLDALAAAAVAGAAAGTAALLSLIKGWIAQQFGAGTAATLPVQDEPVYPGNAELDWSTPDGVSVVPEGDL